jgi:hypothetical protein
MKWFIPLLLIGIMGIAACTSASNQAIQKTSQPPSLTTAPTASTTDLEPTASPPPTLPSTTVASGLAWDTSPGAKVIIATFCCGLSPELLRLNYLPVAQVWGDGRILWSKIDAEGHRQVWEGMLSQEQMTGLLQSAVNVGFFDWEELYKSPDSPTDLPPRCVSIQLRDQVHRVCEYQKGAPRAFTSLYTTLENGAGLDGKDYKPAKGFLVAHPQSASYNDSQVPVWDAKSTNITLSQAINGLWVEGPALDAVWELLKSKPAGPIVMHNGDYYQLSLQIPGVSLMEPPAP